MKNITTILLCIFSITINAQVITTIVGGGGPGDGGPATQSSISQPYGTAMDSMGNIYIADYNGHRVRKISVTGIITTVAGNGVQASTGDGGPAKSSSVAFPSSVALDKYGNLYISEGQRIRKIGADGIITTVAGNGSADYNGDNILAINASLYWPQGIAIDSTGNLFIADINHYRVRKVDTNGIITTIAGIGKQGFTGDGGLANAARISTVTSVAVDGYGNIFFADGANYRLRKISTNGIITTIAGTGTYGFTGDGGAATLARIAYPTGVLTDNQGNIFFADGYNNRIRKINPSGIISTIVGSGTHGYGGDGGLAINASLAFPQKLLLDGVGNLYISDAENSRVRKVDTAGFITTIAGSSNNIFVKDNIQALDAQLNGPTSVTTDQYKNIYIADFNNAIIRKVSTEGVITTFAGGGTSGLGDGGDAKAAQLYSPTTITFDKAGNLYIADRDDNRVRKVTPNGIITTIAGNGTEGYSGDGGLAVNAQFHKPYAVVVDPKGNIFISDQYTHCVRKIDTSGIITTVAGNGTAGFNGDGPDAKVALLYFPSGLASDRYGNIFISDKGNHRIRELDTNNAIITVAGGGGDGIYDSVSALLTDFDESEGLRVDDAGNIYIADYHSQQVSKVSPNGMITKLAGIIYGAGYAGDGGNAGMAQLNHPYDIAVDDQGNVYIADGDNNRIRKVTQANVAVITGSSVVCRNNPPPLITFTYSGPSLSAPYTFTYRINGGAYKTVTTLSGNSVSIDAATNIIGSFTYSLVSVTDNALYATVQKSEAIVIVNDIPQSNITASGPVTNLCPGKTITLTASSAAAYLWNTGATTQSIVVNATGNYVVIVTNSSGCNNRSDTTKVTYKACAKPTGLSVSNVGATTAKISWTATPCAVGYQYEWKKKGTTIWTTAQTSNVTRTISSLSANTTYQWRVITACKITPDTITSPGYTNGSEFKTLTTSVAAGPDQYGNLKKLELHAHIYPNPAKDFATVSISGITGEVQLTLSDLNGKQLWRSDKQTSANVSIPIENLASGTYIVMVTDQKAIVMLKLVKER